VAVFAPNLKTVKERRKRGLPPNVFGTHRATETVALLAKYGPLRIDLGIRHQSSKHAATLVRVGLIATYWARSPQSRRITVAALNEAHPAAPEIAALGRAIGRKFVTRKLTNDARRFTGPLMPKSTPADVRAGSADILGRGLRQRVLLAIAALGKRRAWQVTAASQTISVQLVETSTSSKPRAWSAHVAGPK
jgi:hypothetical protein